MIGENKSNNQQGRSKLPNQEHPATANNWTAKRKYSIIIGYLRGSAALWYDNILATIYYWNTYSVRFNNLKRLVDPGDHLPDDYEIRLFLNGLKSNITARVIMADSGNLRATINKTRTTEAETYY
ncbi:3757_t:CDS:2 [Funneliformis caledonium]|uniref:3757_t:CDS:1 n=1 Tax=Funneliformis caledonium TaxID=1117310 RepID=A0A9N9C8S3_9GLOM|nr:3757_t:CDS:2 [Funneliformis caledonium]